jgi:hypothetical protein
MLFWRLPEKNHLQKFCPRWRTLAAIAKGFLNLCQLASGITVALSGSLGFCMPVAMVVGPVIEITEPKENSHDFQHGIQNQ